MLNDKVIRTAFGISFACHLLLLGAPALDINYSPKVEKPHEVMFEIEIEKPLLLPEIKQMGQEKKLKDIIANEEPNKPRSKAEPNQADRVEIFDKPAQKKLEVLNPSQDAMLRYQDMVKQAIESNRHYPIRAQRMRLEGVVDLAFVINSGGSSRDIRIIKSSGSKFLDAQALETIRKASPFMPLPEEISKDSVDIRVAIVFSLQ
ncbi:MAG: energy transducer TonB [Candidatus Omnitrophica bacterium]|nr:energy transducer TonB [Candidatus Omnitrophota bacterium]